MTSTELNICCRSHANLLQHSVRTQTENGAVALGNSTEERDVMPSEAFSNVRLEWLNKTAEILKKGVVLTYSLPDLRKTSKKHPAKTFYPEMETAMFAEKLDNIQQST
jgi:hypothetical protein